MKKIFTSAIVLLGVLAGARAQTNLIEWQTNWPAGTATAALAGPTNFALPGSSSWFSSKQASLVGTPNSAGTKTNLVATIASSLTVWTYYAPSNAPVTLSPGSSLRVSMDFNVVGSAAQNSSHGLRVGLLYAGTNNGVGQTYWNGSGYVPSGTASQTNYWGYAQQLNFGTTFGVAPLQTYAYTNGVSPVGTGAVLASTTLGEAVGGNGGGTTNDVGFVDMTNYTLVMTITETNATNVSITTTVSGPGLSNSVDQTSGYISQTVVDTNFCYTNFDTFVLRPTSSATVAPTFTITSFKVEEITNAASLNVPSLAITVSGNQVIIAWPATYLGYWLQTQTDSLTTGLTRNWTDVANSSTVNRVTNTINTASGAVFYRLSSQP